MFPGIDTGGGGFSSSASADGDNTFGGITFGDNFFRSKEAADVNVERIVMFTAIAVVSIVIIQKIKV